MIDYKPLPPDVLANAIQDRVTPTSGRLLSATPVEPFARERVLAREWCEEHMGAGCFDADEVEALARLLHRYGEECRQAVAGKVEGK